MNFDRGRGILGNHGAMDQGLLGAPPSSLSMGFGSSSGRGGGMLESGMGSRIGLDDDLLRSRHSQLGGGSDSIWDSRGSSGGGYGILGEPGHESSLFSRSSSLGLGGLSSLGLDRSPAPLLQPSDVARFRSKGDGYGGRSRRRDRMDTGRSGRSPSPRRYRERSPLGMRSGDDYDPANPTGSSGMTVCHACHVDLGSNQRWREHMQSDGHLMVMQELGCKAEQEAFHLKNEMRNNIRRRRRSSGDQPKEPKRYKEGVDNYCRTCEKEFFGPFRHHSDLPDHRKRYAMIRDGCRWCGVTKFERFKDLQAHRASEDHLKKQRQHDEEREKSRKDYRNRRGGGNRRSGRRPSTEKKQSEQDGQQEDVTMKDEENAENGDYVIKSEDESAVQEEVAESKDEVPKETASNEDAAKDEPKEAVTEQETSKNESQTETKESRKYPRTTLADLPAEYDPNMALGQNYIREVTGFFCKLCRRFYSNEELAFQNHCKSEQHFRKLKVYLQQKAGAGDVSEEDVSAS